MNLPEGHSLQNTKYHLSKVIGQGGFGITYLGVWNTEVKGELGTVKTEVPVCIKEYFFKDYCYRDKATSQVLVHSETGRLLFEKFKEKLIKEAKILSEVHHPYIVNVLEVFEENNTAYIAMEHISGCSLKYMLYVEGALPENKVLRYIAQIGQALEFVHQKSILHLDIKPGNILIDKKNNARLIDFGVSKRYDIEQQETSTTTLTLSKGFAPIEQYDDAGTQSFSPCPDIYSLGATMYNLLTGVIPTESILRVAKQLSKPSEINKKITQKTENTILKAMQVNPVHRYQSVKAMINELDIPSYFEETTNSLIESVDHQSKIKDDDETVFNPDSNKSQPVDTEQTIIRQPEDPGKPDQKKKSKRRILIPFMIFIFAFLGYGVVYLLELNGSQGEIIMPGIQGETAGETGEIIGETGETGEAGETGSSILRGENTLVSGTVEPTRPEATRTQEANTPVSSGNPETPPGEEVNTVSQEMIEARYTALIESGKAKMGQKNYADATIDFEKARELQRTDDVVLLLDAAKTEERKTLYQSFTSFGDLLIVKKKSNGRWGAIDNKGIEKIECKYLSSNPSENNRRAFEREDNHYYDIYDATGELKWPNMEKY